MQRFSKTRVDKKNIALLVVVMFISILIVFSFLVKDNRKLNFIEKSLKDGLIFIEEIVVAPFEFVGKTFNKLTKYNDTYAEYEVLKQNSEAVNNLISQNTALQQELTDLKSQLEVGFTLFDYEKINATVTLRNNTYWFNTITINKGTNDGIKEDMAVINHQGLIGKVIKTTFNNSVVKLITTSDNANQVSATLIENGDSFHGLVTNYDVKNNYLIFEGISNHINTSLDNAVLTSGLGGIYPAGITIGYIKELKIDAYGLSKIIMLEPAVDFNNLKYVSVLKRKDYE